MTAQNQRQELQRNIWSIADQVRGAVDGWDFKQYILGILFYRFISENFQNYIEAGDPEVHYADYPDEAISTEIIDDAVKTKGYYIAPSQLFSNVVKTARENDDLNTKLKEIFAAIEASAVGYSSENDIKGLFDDLDTTSNRLGNTVKEKNKRLADVLEGINQLNFGRFEDNQIDLFGDAYEFLISNYASNAGKSGGEFFTPQSVSALLAKIVMLGKDEQNKINKIYDPACGSGSLLLQARKQFSEHIIEEGFFGQEINMTTYNLARMNMFLHNINYDKFDIKRGDTLINPLHNDDKPFDAIVSNPPYSIKWIGSDDPTLINDDRSGAIISYLGITLKDKKYLTPQSLSKAKEEAYRSEIDKLTEELTQSNQNLTDFVKEKLAETQSEFSSQTEEFNNQYQDITTLAQEQLGKTQEEFNNLKAAYEQQLSFEAPITHWNEQSTNRAKLAIFWAIGAVVEVIVIIVLAGWLLHNLYSGQYKVASDIPQYFVPIALISILVYVLRVCINIAVSNWHMSSEYSQKAALTTYYLSMLKEGHISEGEKAYVLPALFAKIDTGLNKYQSESDDSSIMSLINSVRNGAGK